jgi:alginate O-acetyltransferase complex protein AlgI
MAFFPKLLAGPIVSPSQFLPQIQETQTMSGPRSFPLALRLITVGLVKKVVIADSLASITQIAFRAAGLPPGQWAFPSPLYWQGFYLYAFQIYADFSGYTDLARGSAALLGFSLPENFERPYFASRITEFWNRWHISLTLWFREYLFFPFSRKLIALAKRRHMLAAQIIANLVTMTLIGLWHGAGWTFIAWGAWHGLLLSVERILNVRPVQGWQKLLRGAVVFHLVGLGWVLFGASSFTTAWRFLSGMVSLAQMNWLPQFLPIVLLTGALVFGIDWLARDRPTEPAQPRPQWAPVLIVASWVLVLFLLTLRAASGSSALPFIYGQF